MIAGFLSGIRSYGRALSLSSQYRLWKYWLVPGLIGFFIAVVLAIAVWQGGTQLGDLIRDWYPFERGAQFVDGAAPWIARTIMIVFGILIFKYILLIVLSPFLSLLSERLEARLDGHTQSGKFSLVRAFREMVRGLRIALRNLWREIILVLLLTALSFIGPIGLISAPLIFIVQAYYAGFGNFDFTMERRYNVRESVQLVRHARGAAIANGAVFLLLLATVVGIFVAPTWSTIAGTLDVRRIEGAND